MYLIIWRYRVVEGRDADFRAAYGSDGEWGALFSTDESFLGVELVALPEPGEYITIDRWESEESYTEFMEMNREGYRETDLRMETLTESEELVAQGTVHPSR
jgi:heme-degrading monooxygenase HmoA